MRILFTFAGGSGHLEPLVPIARAAEATGHTVAFAGRPWMLPVVEAFGFRGFAAGSDVGLTPRRVPLAAIDVQQDMGAVGPGFGLRIARERAADLLPLCHDWRPDLLVCEELDFGAMIVAERLELPFATVLVIAAGSFVRAEFVAGPLNEVRAEHGLPPDPALAMPSRHLVLSPFAPSYRDPRFPLPASARSLRSLTPRSVRKRDTLTIYFTLGTVYNVECGDLFQRVLAGLRDLPIELIVTVGRDIDPIELGPQPGNVRVERYVPQGEVLPHCDLVVSHAGSGSVTNALAHGLPMVLLPLGADQPLNAARCETLGVARVLDAVSATPEMVRAAASVVLKDRSFRRNAERIRDEMAALSGPDHAIGLLERLGREKQ